MSKSLSQLLAEVEPENYLMTTAVDEVKKSVTTTNVVDRASYDKLKAIAVELAKACEEVYRLDHKKHSDCSIEVWGCGLTANVALTTARKMLGDE